MRPAAYCLEDAMASDVVQKLAEFEASMAQFSQENKVETDIQFPVEISGLESRMGLPRTTERTGEWVSIRPVRDTKTYLGIYLGDFTLECFHSYNLKTKILTAIPHRNPAIWVPDLKRVIWGCESWWGVIDTPEKLREISDADIQDIWYVKALKELTEKSPPATQ
jgi:hypothetical protein